MNNIMNLYEVTINVKKNEWNKSIELKWAVIASTSDEAIEKILSLNNDDNVIIDKMEAKKKEYIIIK